jgi:hypothetical protein
MQDLDDELLDRMHTRVLAERLGLLDDCPPMKESAAYDDPSTPLCYYGQARHREDDQDHAPPSSRDGDAVRFGLALVVIFGLMSLLVWLAGY